MSDLLTINGSEADAERIMSPAAIRAGATRMLEHALDGGTSFVVHRDHLGEVARRVARRTEQRFPNLEVPFHSRWRHFDAGSVDRMRVLHRSLAELNNEERVKAKLDLALVSVLLDAGAGRQWRYHEESSGADYPRSEGLALASFYMFLMGSFSSDANNPYQVDAQGLRGLTIERLRAGFQASAKNPLTGLEGRHELLQSLAAALEKHAAIFGEHPARPGNLLPYLRNQADNSVLHASQILSALQSGLSSIWPGRVHLGGKNLGDVWAYAPFGEGVESLVPFHKLMQWLSYSLMEPLAEGGLEVSHLGELTGLAEYRNGGLFIDGGVLVPRDPGILQQEHTVGSEVVVEWRALTLALLDELAPLVRQELGRSEMDLPLVSILEGGTWLVGREMAFERSPDGSPPLSVISDGTVF